MCSALEDFSRCVVVPGKAANASSRYRIRMDSLLRSYGRSCLRILRRSCARLLYGLIIALAAGPAWPDGDASYRLAIPAGPAGASLRQFAEQTGYQLLYRSDWIVGMETHAIEGEYPIDKALELLLRGTGLDAEMTREGVIILVIDNKTDDTGDDMRSESKGFSLKKIVAGIASALAATSGVAADTQQSKAVLEEVVVTATKRQVLLTDVAETINVVTSERLENFNIYSFSDVQALTPGLTMQEPDPRTQSVSLRGLPFDPDSNTSATVVTYWNGIQVRSNVAFNQLFDIRQIEVLRGPQGTLQGQTSPSGAIQIVTQQADSESVHGNIRQTFADNSASITDVALNMPLIEGKLGLRVAGVYNDNELYGLKSVANGRNATSLTRAGRFNLYFTPTEAFDASLTYEYLERFTDGLEYVEGIDALNNGHPPTLSAYDRRSVQLGSSDIGNRNQLVNLTANWHLADHTLTLVSGYQNNLNSSLRDRDVGNVFPTVALDQYVGANFEVWSHELRLANNDSGPWKYIVGLYYYDSTSYTVNQNASARGGVLPGTPPTPALVMHTESRIPILSETYAAFTDHMFDLTDSSRLQVGLRWQKNKAFQQVNTYALEVPGVPPGTLIQSSIPKDMQADEKNALTGTLKFAHDLNDEWTVYASYGRSHRMGGATITPDDRVTADLLIYGEEKSDSLEIGFKSDLGGGRYRVNGAVYYQKFDDFQNRSKATFLDLDGDGELETAISGGLNYNADAVVRGAELEMNALLTDNWHGYAAVSYTDAKLDGAAVPCGSLGDAADPGSQARTCSSDGRIGPEPNWSFTASTEYTLPGLIGGTDGFIRALYKFNGSRHDDFAALNTYLYDEYALGSYGIWDLYLGVRAPDRKWEVSLWSKNLFDKEAKTRLGTPQVQLGLDSGFSTVSVIPERTIGVTARYNFGGF